MKLPAVVPGVGMSFVFGARSRFLVVKKCITFEDNEKILMKAQIFRHIVLGGAPCSLGITTLRV
jgi:hypothetical protein